MYKIGFKFKVVKNGIIGVIDGVSTLGIYSVVFYMDEFPYYRADVFEGTITNNLQNGVYEEIE